MCIKYCNANSYNVCNKLLKGLNMDLKSNKGYVGIDITIAVLILIILVPTIMGIVYNINLSKHSTGVKSEALSIAVNTIETAKACKLEMLTEQQLLSDLNSSNIYVMNIDNATNSAIITTSTASYILDVEVEDYSEIDEEAQENILKRLTVNVKYKVGNKEQSINIKNLIK